MQVFTYSIQDKSYLGPLNLKDNEPMPANATTVVPPSFGILEIPVFDGEKWEIYPYYKNATVWEKSTGKEVVYNTIGGLPESLTSVPCPDKDLYSWNNGWVQDPEKYLKRDRSERSKVLNSNQWIFSRHESEKRLVTAQVIANTTLTDAQILELDIYFQAWRDFTEQWYLGKTYPTKPEWL